MLLFSDGRQRAANLARDLKNAQAVDQGRAMFVYLHKQKWFQSIPEKNRTLHRLYPYLCLFSALARNNPLTDSDAKPERSKMISHTVLLISNALCEFKDEIPELKDIMEKCQPDDIDGLIQEFMRLRIINTMKRVTNGYLYKNRNHDSLKQVKASLTKAFNNKRNEFAKSEQNWKVIAEMISLGGSNDELSSCLEELGTLKSIDNAPELNDQLLTTECKKLTELAKTKIRN